MTIPSHEIHPPEAPASAVVIEVAGSDVGLALRERRGFRFVAADRRFAGLDGRQFKNLQVLQRAARLYARAQQPRDRLAVRSTPGF